MASPENAVIQLSSLMRKYWPLWLTVAVALTAFLVFMAGWFMSRDMDRVPFTLYSNYFKISFIVVLFTGAGWLTAIYVLVFSKQAIVLKLLVLFLIISGTIFSGLGFVINLFETFRPYATAQTVNDSYNLARRGGVGHDTGYYDLYKCDLAGLNCEKIYHLNSIYELTPDQIDLQLNNSTKTLSVLIDDQLVYTHPIE